MNIDKNYNENCLDTMKKMPDNFVDLVVTSPPYDNLRKYNGFTFDFENIARELYRVVKQGGVVVWIVADQTINGSESGTSFKQALFFKEVGFNLHDTMIWHKPNAIPLTHNRYEQHFEYMFVFSKGKPKTFNPILEKCVTAGAKKVRNGICGENSAERHHIDRTITKQTKYHENIFTYSVGSHKNVIKHPAQFPEQLVKDHIISWSNENDIIYDPFAGSGTTLKVAKDLNRKYIGSEISKEYCDIINRRINSAISQIKLEE